MGETGKNIKAAFQKSRETGALLLFDEADSILGQRLSNVRQSTDHAVNLSCSVMLLELDQFSGVTVFAINLASNYDTAFIRRILGDSEGLAGSDILNT
ncbi:MAG TPA: AAA family ATPase, partial [Anaerolineales bacterium]|nr:AAA family ATPase [Anaerolineales bacterium]